MIVLEFVGISSIFLLISNLQSNKQQAPRKATAQSHCKAVQSRQLCPDSQQLHATSNKQRANCTAKQCRAANSALIRSNFIQITSKTKAKHKQQAASNRQIALLHSAEQLTLHWFTGNFIQITSKTKAKHKQKALLCTKLHTNYTVSPPRLIPKPTVPIIKQWRHYQNTLL